ncbi:MAG: acetylxylan esterase [Ignavibacteriae bacterium]|nr:acetylxylan esterase [Ignavibacteriota bacterium]MCB9218097.1 acetylxylan esterase [Ignavibacteriales bacterium]MCB9260486.1 acetylxylan esterase [Ignavibacteriales bacterium]
MKIKNIILNSLFILLNTILINAQIIDSPPDTVAGIPANYYESKTGEYTLPNPLLCQDGSLVETQNTWLTKRRDEIIKLFEDNQFGVTPKFDYNFIYEVYEKGTLAINGKAKRTQVTINLFTNGDKQKLNVLYYLPFKADKPSPMLLYISFRANSQVIDDPEIIEGYIWDRNTKEKVLAGRESRFGKTNVENIIDSGFGFATIYYGDIEPDFEDGYKFGIRTISNSEDNKSNTWGSFAVWSWGLSRVLDYFETDKAVDSRKTTIMGVSRLGKTVLWAGALDERFAAIIPVCSGESGASLSRRNYGETIVHIASPLRYHYWFAPKYQEFCEDVSKLPVDGHMLISLIAPRPILLITGNTDKWSDPYGEYLAAKAAEPVYHLFGKKGLETDKQPREEIPVLNDISFFMHDGGHGMIESDWKVILDFLQNHFTD